MTNRTMSGTGDCCTGQTPPMDAYPRADVVPRGDSVPHEERMSRMEENGGCTLCGRLAGYPLAMAYVPMQSFENLYSPETALCAGTLFADLDMPFCGKTVSDSAYPRTPARTCGAQNRACGCGMMRGGNR